MKFLRQIQDGQTMICNNNYLADILMVCEIKDLIWVMRFQSPLVYLENLLIIDNPYFGQMVCQIYPTELQFNNSSNTEAPF